MKDEYIFKDEQTPFYALVEDSIKNATGRKAEQEAEVKDLVEEMRKLIPETDEEIEAMSDEARNDLVVRTLGQLATREQKLEFMGADGLNHEIEFKRNGQGKMEAFLDKSKVTIKQIAGKGIRLTKSAARTTSRYGKQAAGALKRGLDRMVDKAISEFGR